MITPREAAVKNDKLHADILAKAEKELDAILARNYSTGRSVSIDVDQIPVKDYFLRGKLLDKYKENGWKIEEFDCQGRARL